MRPAAPTCHDNITCLSLMVVDVPVKLKSNIKTITIIPHMNQLPTRWCGHSWRGAPEGVGQPHGHQG